MTRVNLIGAADDGLNIIVETDAGERFMLPISDELRHAVRYARPKAMHEPDEDAGSSLTPKDIQQRIRAGLTAAELSELTGMAIEALEKFEPPVIAERAYVAELARTTRIGRDASAPVLGELVTDRLAGRGVESDDVSWDAWREVDEPWQVCVDFRVDGRSVRALWSFDHASRTLTAEDEESRWLTETELLDVPIPVRHLSAVRGADAAVLPLPETRPVMPAPSLENQTELLLEDLDNRRGTREAITDDDDIDPMDDVFEGFGPAANSRSAEVNFTGGASMPHPAGSARRDVAGAAPAASATPEKGTADGPADAEDKPAARRGRASVPSWDEIVFGAKHDQA